MLTLIAIVHIYYQVVEGWIPASMIQRKDMNFVQIVGRGVFGCVFKAVHHPTRRIVAGKMYSADGEAAYFLNELVHLSTT